MKYMISKLLLLVSCGQFKMCDLHLKPHGDQEDRLTARSPFKVVEELGSFQTSPQPQSWRQVEQRKGNGLLKDQKVFSPKNKLRNLLDVRFRLAFPLEVKLGGSSKYICI
jgi:hypothetical protein